MVIARICLNDVYVCMCVCIRICAYTCAYHFATFNVVLRVHIQMVLLFLALRAEAAEEGKERRSVSFLSAHLSLGIIFLNPEPLFFLLCI